MSSVCRGSLVAAVVAAALCACDREERVSRGKPLAETIPATASRGDPRAAMYAGNAYAISQGQRLFNWMNCVGCHAHGGGGMGPALMDDRWRYGGSIEQIAATIYQGRPNGMPSWKDKLTEQQIWQLAAYVRTLSGQQRKDSVAARADTLSNTPPQTQARREPLRPASGDAR